MPKGRKSNAVDIVPLPVIHHPREPWQTDAQYEASRRFDEERAVIDAVLQKILRRAAFSLDYPQTCLRRECRRAKSCVAPIRESDWCAHFGRTFPPCCNTPERIEEVRALVRS